MEKYMSLGTSCHISELLRNTGRRISGPFDWMANSMIDKYRSIIYHLSDVTYENILLRKFSPTIGIELIEKGTTLDFSSSMWYPHHDLNDIETLKKFIRRFNRFREHIRSGGNLIFMSQEPMIENGESNEYFVGKILDCIKKYNLVIGKLVIIEVRPDGLTHYHKASKHENIIWITTNIPFNNYYIYRDNKNEELLNKDFNNLLEYYESKGII